MTAKLFKAFSFFLILILASMSGAEAETAATRTVTDLAGRTVTVPQNVSRVILGEGRFISALAILDRESPLQRVVGMMGEFPLLEPDGYNLWKQAYPAIEDVPHLGKASSETFSVEKAISLEPQVAIFGLAGHGPGPDDTAQIERLESAGITVVYIDFFLDPIVNTPTSITVLGQVLGRETQAASFVAAYQDTLQKVSSVLTSVEKRPTVFLENRVGLSLDCCASIGHGVLAKMIEAAGGENLAAAVIPVRTGIVNMEYLLTHQPDIYVGTAIGNRANNAKFPERILLGPTVTKAMALSSLKQSFTRKGIRNLQAIREKRAYAIWHHFFHSPFNVIVVQVFAKWFHPDLFADLNPEATFTDLTKRFQPLALDGTYWVQKP